LYYNAVDVILLTSLHEGSPNVVKEAMACNCPVVSTDVGDVRWLFGDTPGYFITSFDYKDVVEKIKLAINFREKYYQTKGRERIIDLGLDSGTVAGRIIDVYRQVLKLTDH
jgi:glycosyltransferase involved in cell wall biosynthesis